jgi:predicted lipid carrier protein YhbT
MTVVEREPQQPAAATIRGNLRDLLALLEGRMDGDALFFSGTLSVEGDIEAVLMLRNALDGAEIDVLRDLASAFGPAAGVLQRAFGLSVLAAARAAEMAAVLHADLAAPVGRMIQAQDLALSRLRRDLVDLSRHFGELRPHDAK